MSKEKDSKCIHLHSADNTADGGAYYLGFNSKVYIDRIELDRELMIPEEKTS